jgi:hypothetical protein
MRAPLLKESGHLAGEILFIENKRFLTPGCGRRAPDDTSRNKNVVFQIPESREKVPSSLFSSPVLFRTLP